MTTSKNGRASFSSSSGALLAIPYSSTPGESRNFDLTSSSQDIVPYTIDDPPYLTSQLKSAEWLQRYGLKSQKLTFDQILQQIGYRRIETFVPSIGKKVGAKYTGNQYHEVQHDNGDRYILTCRPEKLREFKNHVGRMLNLLKKRLAFITNGSRRVFGIIGEPSVCFVCDCKTTDQRRFDEFRSAITNLLKEQVTKIKRFNIIWVSNDKEQFQEQPIDVKSTTVDQAIDWICDRKCAQNKISISATSEAILKAFTNSVHSIYLITEGESSDSAREILRDNIVKTRLSSNTPIPIHVVSLFCQNNDTETFLRSIAQTANGSYISYKIHNGRPDLKPLSNLTNPTGIKFQDDKLHFGTNVSMTKPEQPIDLALMYKEIHQCHSVIDRLDKILEFVRDENESALQKYTATKSLDASNMSKTINKNDTNLQRSLIIQSSALFSSDESEMTSMDWLKIYGIDAQKLDVISVLQPVAFRHCDGVVTVFKPPEDANGNYDKTPANPKTKLINAKYCDQFAHIAWSDGTIRHVFVTTELHRDYERRLRALLEKIKARLSWLRKGSRDLFGTIIEKNIYILIDTSISMRNHLDFVKQKLRLLIQDQLFSKERINIVAFNTTTNSWRDRLTKVNDSQTLAQLQPWIDDLYAEGSTNTLDALRFALADPNTEAIYLLTDGRPDQSERHILSQVEYREKVPIHTIAFNCQDEIANQFLIDLSKLTGGRFHAFIYGMETELSPEIPESEDVTYLKQELARGEKDLQHVADLRDECTGRAWSLNTLQAKYKSPRMSELPLSLTFRSHSTLSMTSASNNSPTMPQRIDRKKCSSVNSTRRKKSKSAIQVFEKTSRIFLNPNQWLLPETEEYLRNNDKQPDRTSIIEYQERQVQPIELIKKIPTPFDEVKSYLKKNNLVSKGLTIFDVLYPTSITVKAPLHVQVIDRYVLSKVWDDILPLAYGSFVNKLRLVNHYAVDLESYERKLKDLITDYYQFTSKFIWKCLSDEDKRKLGPHIYWIILSNEDQNKLAHEITQEEHTNQSALEMFAWKKLSDDKQTNLLQKPAIYDEKTQVILKEALKNAGAESALQGVARMDVEIQRAVKFLQISTDLRQYQKRAENESKEKIEQKTIIKKTSSTYRNTGQRVICRYDADGYFYPGSLQKGQDGRSIILFDMDIEQEAIGHILLPINNLQNQTNLFLNDRVLVRQMREMEEYWSPGLVLSLPSPFTLPANLYMIQVHDPLPKQIYAHRRDMVRITVGLFQRSVLYIQNIHQKSVTNYRGIFGGTNTPPPLSPGQTQIEKMLRELLGPLTEKVERLSKSHHKRYHELKRALEDQMAAIRILQDRSFKPPVKFEYAQTDPKVQTSTSSSTPDTSRPTSTQEEYPTLIQPGTTVYAVWSDDDGLVYKGTVVQSNNPNNYKIERADLHGIESDISRNDIFLELCLLKDIKLQSKEESFAFVKYPNDSRHCLCPAVILHRNQTETRVRFYDCFEKDIDNNQNVIPINGDQFKSYSSSRIDKEKDLVNKVTVGLNSETNTFMLGTIKERVGNGHQYLIEWFDESTSEQKDEHLFGAFTRRHNHRKGDYVIAMDNDDTIYKLARIVSISNDRKSLKVEFSDLRNNEDNSPPRRAEVPATTTFVITEAYYNKIINLPHT